MAKLKKPLLSLGARGGLGKAISFVKRGGRSIAEKKPEIPDARTLAQLSWRHMYQKAVALWHALSPAEKQEWESLARPKHMTGFAWFVSQALKPNPGLYLPLQGGKMAGDIDMDGNKIENLPDPTADQEPATKKYHDDNLPAGPYTQGCRVWNNFNQTFLTGIYDFVNFTNEEYDTDTMHDLVVNPERITIKTAGIYIITFHAKWASNTTGYRRAGIILNASTWKAEQRLDAPNTTNVSHNITTHLQLSIGDYLRARAYQNSGGDLNMLHSTHYSPYFMAQRVG